MGSDPLTPTKRCKVCGEDKPVAEFYAKGRECKPCNIKRVVKWQKENPLRDTLKRAKYRARLAGVPFDLKLDQIPAIPTHCPVLGLELQRGEGSGNHGPNSPSLDRIIPSLGYVQGNLMWISNRANTLKRDATVEELLAVATFYQQLIGGSNDTSGCH